MPAWVKVAIAAGAIVILAIIVHFIVPQSYTITVEEPDNGSITPRTEKVSRGSAPLFNIVPKPGYVVVEVTVDGSKVVSGSSYRFPPVYANHTIAATFQQKSAIPGRTYTLQRGDTLAKIAKEFGVTPDALRNANPDLNPTRPRIGETITIPPR
jgi:LysM repeat protein